MTAKDGDQTYVRFGFKGETQINDQLTGYGRWEAEFLPATKPKATLHRKRVWRLLV
jgi:outer membrane pore protein E